MCGIFAYLGEYRADLAEFYNRIKHRGPDSTHEMKIAEKLFLAFHRLAINGFDKNSEQPFRINEIILICNGEIYNYHQIIKEEGWKDRYQSGSDCEIILHLYQKYGIEETVNKLDGVFAFILYDGISNELFVARDQLGVRPLYYSERNGLQMSGFASEGKALLGLDTRDTIYQFPAGCFWRGNLDSKRGFFRKFSPDYFLMKMLPENITEEEICKKIRGLLERAVEKRMMSDRKICCLLSGGLDSSLITALVARHYPRGGINTYAIGLEGSVDLRYARIVANYLGTNHTEVVVSEEEFLEMIEPTIRQIESYCITTVRASVGNYLISLYIKRHIAENGGDTVVFCGDISDELFGGYRGFLRAPDASSFQVANIKMLNDIHFFDVLRCDKSISGAGLEPRTPFEDRDLINYVMSIPAKFKMFGGETGKIEKHLLRKAFADSGVLPEEILWRKKEAFSDGVSGEDRSWYQIIREYVNKKIPEEGRKLKYRLDKYQYSHLPPFDKESLWYREIFEKYYKENRMEFTIPYYWRHPFNNVMADPSARSLKDYHY